MIFKVTWIIEIKSYKTCQAKWDNINDLLTGLLSPYKEIRSPIFFVRPELARAVRKSEGLMFPVQNK